LQQDYDGNSDHKDKATSYTYDTSNGAVLTKTEFGLVSGSSDGSFTDSGTDKRTTQLTYATNTSGVVTVSKQTLLNNSSITLAEAKNYFDNQSFGVVTNGNRTKQQNWIASSTYVDTIWTYNGYGLPTSVTDANSHTTNYSYDLYNLFVATTTNALSQKTVSSYDYATGKVATTTNVNGEIYATSYDGLGRPLYEKIPDPQSGATVIQNQYNYVDTTGAVNIAKTSNLSTSTSNTTYTYLDGLGRPIQTRSEAEDVSNYNSKDIVYGVGGLVSKQSLPYFSTGSSFTTATTSNSLYTLFSYDALNRVRSATTSVGTTLTNYDQWQTLVTDPLGHHKELTTDAFGHLTQVDEHNGTSTYTTVYDWDAKDNLLKITDALSNIRNLTYDGLSRRTSIEDLHATGDSTFGAWNFAYDAASNLGTSTNPNGNIVVYTYDSLNRPLTENYQAQVGTEITYTYDSCTKGIGLLCSVNNLNSATTTYTYGHTGKPATEAKTIGGVNYTNAYEYDRTGNQTLLTYPDNSIVRYTYNKGNLLEKVEQRENGGAYRDIVTNFNYNPIGSVVYQLFGNGASTTKTYDDTKLYRLLSIVTSATNPTGGGGEELAQIETGLSLDATDTSTTTMDDTSVPTEETLLLDDASITPLLPDSGISTETVLSTSTESVDDADGEKTSPTIDIPLLAETKNLEVVPKNIADITPRETVTTYQLSSSQKDTSKRIDVELSKDTPMVRFKKWNGTADFALSYNSVKGVADYSTERNVTKWSDDSESVEAYPLVAAEGMEEGGLEMEVVLATTSKTNTFNFTVSGADNLDFFYQPPLTQEKLESNIVRCTETDCYDEKGAVVVHRPENIVGSYAVYSKNKKDAISGKVDYGTGKVGHIYRPKVVDAVGTEVWAIMSYQNGMLSITVPQAFLDKAIYPVRVDPTFGYGSVGGTNATTWNYVGSKFQMNNENGTLTKISAYTRKDTAGTMNKIAALYSDAAGSSSILLASSSVTSGVSTTSAWVDMTMPSYALASNTTYWLWQGHDASGWVYWDTGATNQYNIQGVTYPTWPSPFTPGTYFARILSVYATYSTTSASNTAPTAPASLLTEGSINPTNVATTAPKFSAIYTDADTSDKAISYQIQVSTSSSFSSTKWDSGQTTLSASTTQGNRTPDITYAGSALASSTTYYWRIKFWDIAGASGAWSTATNTFMLASSTNATSTATSSSTYPIFVQFPQYLVYSYDAVGNITQIVDRSGTHSAATTTYAYDDLSRLLSASTTQASSTPYSQSYAYNAIGNITYKSDIGNFLYQGATGTLYANPHAATLVNGITYTYDKNGNLASTSASTTNTWNYRNRLTSILKNGTTSTYLYGASDERVSKTTNGITTKYPSQYVDVVGASTTKHIYAGDSLLASVDGSGSTTNSIYFNHLDHLGSTADVTNNIGYLNNLYTYYPYGGSRLEEGAGVGSSSSPTPSPLYIDAVDSSWTDSSWNTTITNSTSTVYSGTKSLKVVYTASWGGVSYARSLNTTPYTTIDFYVYVGTTVPDLYLYFLNQSGTLIQTVTVSDYTTGGLTANTWQHVSVPLSALGIVNYNNLLYFSIESSIPTTVYYDQVQFFGTATNTSAGFSQSNQFIGQNHDYETDLNYLNSRYLNSNNGQFLSEDPVFWEVGQTPDGKAVLTNPQAQNSYSYAQNNPVVQKDPDGRLGWDALSNPYNYGSVLTQVGGWYLASKIFDISGNSFTGSLMRHSLSWNPQSVNVTETNQRFWGNAVNQVKNSSEFKSALNNYLSVDGKNGAIDKTYANSGNGLSSIQFNSGDLEAGIHGTYSTKVTGNQNSDGSWNLNVNISDQYDYRYQGYKGGERNSTLTGANNAARFSQGQNVISDYGVNIKFSLQNYKQKTKQ
jgi:RHS repeat-associated protein